MSTRSTPNSSLEVRKLALLQRRNNTVGDLWEKALEQIPIQERQLIDSQQTDRRQLLSDLMVAVEEQKAKCVEREWRFARSNGNVVVIRDCLDKVTEWLKRFQEVGDAAMQYDTGHAALPWAGVRFLINITIQDHENYCQMIGGVEFVASVLARYVKVEELYLHSSSPLQDELHKKLTELYATILQYLAKARRYFERSTSSRFAHSVIKSPVSIERSLALITQKALDVEKLDIRRIATFLNEGFQGLHEKLSTFESKLESLQASRHGTLIHAEVGHERLVVWLKANMNDKQEQELENALEKRTRGTCEWIFQVTQFKDWISEPKIDEVKVMRYLWIHGPQGFGKTILCASILEHLKRPSHSLVAYFFCNTSDEAKRYPTAITRSWITQLLYQNHEAFEIVQEAYQGKEGRGPTTGDIWGILHTICCMIPIIVVVDGFDEYVRENTTTREALDFLQKLVEITADSSTRILVLSRTSADFFTWYREASMLSLGKLSDYRLSIADTKADIITFSKGIAAKNLRNKSPDLQNEVAENVAKRCQGMFLWARLLQDRLRPTENRKELRKIIETMPEQINSTYEVEMTRILDSEHKDYTIALLRLILFAQRPLTVREITEALVINMQDDDQDIYPREYPKDDLPDTWSELEANHRILSRGGSLIELRGRERQLNPQDQTVHLVHFSVREYFLARGSTINESPQSGFLGFSPSLEHDVIARTCLRFLTFKDLLMENSPSLESIREKKSEFHFLSYASRFWHSHARSSLNWSMELRKSIHAFLDPEHRRWILWGRMLEQEEYTERYEKDDLKIESSLASSLYHAALLGFCDTVEHIVNSGASSQVNDTSAALHVATINNDMRTIKFLLRDKTKVDLSDRRNRTSLHKAASYGHDEITKFLTSQNANVNVKDMAGWTPLHSAAFHGHLQIVKGLIEHKATGFQDTKGWTPLHAAASNGHGDIVDLLLQHNPLAGEEEDDEECTALHLAAQNGHQSVVKMLVRKTAMANERPHKWRPIHAAAKNGRTGVVSFLISQGEEKHVKYKDSWTPSHFTALNGHLDTLKILIDQTSSYNLNSLTTQDGWSLLHAGSWGGHTRVVEYLIEQEANVDAERSDGCTPLHLAAQRGHFEVVKMLTESGARSGAENKQGWIPLYFAAQNGHLEVAKHLLAQPTGQRSERSKHWTPLHLAVGNGHIAVAEILIDRGAELECTIAQGYTPLHLAAESGQLESVKLLVERGASMLSVQENLWTPLHLAAQAGHLPIVQFLVDSVYVTNSARDVISMQDEFGRTPAHLAFYCGFLHIVEALVDHHADVGLVDGYGRSLCDWGASNRHLSTILSTCREPILKTPRDMQNRVLMQSISDLLTQLLDSRDPEASPGFYELGHCFIFLEDTLAAIKCFEQQIIDLTESGIPIYSVFCDHCPDRVQIRGLRFVCKTCPEIDLCGVCMDNLSSGQKQCRTHEFLPVTLGVSPRSIDGEIDTIPDEVCRWMRDLVICYQNPK